MQPRAPATCLTQRRAFDLTATPISATEDLADVSRVLAGDVQAFEGIVRRWQGPLVNMAWRYCRDRGRAEEMAQEAFLRAWRGLAQWRQESSFSTWLFALAANVFRSELKRFPTVSVPMDAIAEPRAPAHQHSVLQKKSTNEAVRAAARCQKPWRNPALEEVAMRVARLPMTTEADRKEKWAIIDTLAELDKRTNVAPEVLPPCPNPTSA